MSSLQSLDIIQRSATTSPSPSIRSMVEVAKLIDSEALIEIEADAVVA